MKRPLLVALAFLSGCGFVNQAAPTPPVTSVSVGLLPNVLPLNQTGNALVYARDANGNIVYSAIPRWSSSNPHIATVDSSGAITPVAVGVDTIEAQYEQYVGKAVLTVVQ